MKADGATRSARRRDTATPRLQRPFGGAATLGLSAGVRSTLGFRPPKPAGKNTTARWPASRRSSRSARRDVEGRRVGHLHGEVVAAERGGAAGLDTREHPRIEEKHGSKAGSPEHKARRVAASRHGGASRGFPRSGEQGCGKTPTPRAPDFAAWGSHGAGSPQNSTGQRRDLTRSSHGNGGAQEHEWLRSSIRRGAAVLRLEGQHPGKF
jgi:hypothetical protein